MHLDATRRYGFRELYSDYWNRRMKNGKVKRIDPDNPADDSEGWLLRTRKFFERVTTGGSRWMDYDRRLTEECTGFLEARTLRDVPVVC